MHLSSYTLTVLKSSWKNHCGKTHKDMENEARTRRLLDPVCPQKHGFPTFVNNQADKDMEAEKATTSGLSVSVILQRKGVLTQLDNQRNANATTA